MTKTLVCTNLTLDLDIKVGVSWVDECVSDLSDTFGKYIGEYRAGCIDRVKRGDWKNGQHRYWMPCKNHYPHNPKNWSHVKGKPLADTVKKYGSIKKADAAYVLQDYKRCEAYNNGEWNMTGCIVNASYNSISSKESLFGIESDCGDKYRTQVIDELTSAALGDLKCKILKRLLVE